MARKSSDPKGQNKPVLVYVNEFGIRNSIHKLQEIILPAVRIVQQEFERLRLGPISDAYLKDLLINDMFTIRKEITAQIEKETPSMYLRDEARRKAEEMLGRVSAALAELDKKLDTYVIYDLLEYISVDENGNIVVTEKAIQALREANSIYVTTPKAKEMYEAHKAATKALNRFYQMIKGEITSNIVDVAGFFTIDEDDTVKPTVRDYECSPYVRSR